MALRTIFLLAATALTFIASTEAACPGGRSSCPPFTQVHTLLPNAELRRYEGGVWVGRESPADTFTYTCEFANFYLGDYFRGLNYDSKVMNASTPMVITLNPWDMKAHRLARFFVQKGQTTRVAPPMYPTTLLTEPERWYYVRKLEQTMDFTNIMYSIFKMMADLVLERQPFDQDKVHVAMYNYPKGGKKFTGPNEIWLKKPAKAQPPFNGIEENNLTPEELMAIADSWLHAEKEPESFFDPATQKLILAQ